MNRDVLAALFFILGLALGGPAAAQGSDPLPSWNDGKAKQSIIDFVGRVTTSASPDFVPPAERIATFDNDGCLWAEHAYLRANGFKTFIVSGGGIEFMRPRTGSSSIRLR